MLYECSLAVLDTRAPLTRCFLDGKYEKDINRNSSFRGTIANSFAQVVKFVCYVVQSIESKTTYLNWITL